MIKFTILLRRHPDFTLEQFARYHREQHGPLFASLPEVRQHVRRYVQGHSTGVQIPGLPPLTFDGTTELWFDDMAGLASVFESKDYLETIRPDEAKFLDLQRCEFLVTTENAVIG